MARPSSYSVSAGHAGRVRRALALLIVAMTALSLAPLAGRALAQEDDSTDDPGRTCPSDVPPSDFTDRDAIPHVHLCNVDQAAHLGIVAGFTDGEYKPHRGVSREQMASFVFRTLRAAEVELPPARENRFEDVRAESAHDEAIHRLAAAGVVRGGPLHLDEALYGPKLLIRRDQMASFLMRGIGYAAFDDPDHFQGWPEGAPEDAILSEFPDVPRSNSHYGNVHAGNFQTVVLGFTDGTFRPEATHRRDQMGSSVIRALAAHEVEQTTASVFFNRNGGDPCDEVFPLERQVPAHAPLRGAMQALLAGPTEEEAAAGYWSWFSSETEGMLNSVRIADRTAHVDFADFSEVIPNASTSCGAAILLSQLDSTAEQFDTVDEARYSFDGDEAAFYHWLQLTVPE